MSGKKDIPAFDVSKNLISDKPILLPLELAERPSDTERLFGLLMASSSAFLSKNLRF